MNKLLVLFYAYFLLYSTPAIAQLSQKEIAEFESKIKAAKEDTNKVLLALKFARYLRSDSLKPAIDAIIIAEKLSKKLSYAHGRVMVNFQQGIYLENKKDYPSAIHYYNKAAGIAEHHHLNQDIYDIYNTSLNLYYYLADYTNAMNVAQKGLMLAEHLNNKADQAHFNNQISFIYLKQEKADNAIKYSNEYLALADRLNNPVMVADAYEAVADGYMLKQDYKTSLQYYFKALGIYYKMPFSQTLDKTRMVFKAERIGYTLLKLSTVYKLEGDYKNALRYSELIFKGCTYEGYGFNKYDLATYYINAGGIYTQLKDYKHGGFLLNKGLLLARSILHREDIRDAYNGLSQNFAAQKRYDSAYYYHVLFTGLKDSIINEKISEEINKLEVERRDKEIIVLNQQKKLNETKIAKQSLNRNFIIGLVTLIAIISFLLFYINISIKHQKLVFEKQRAVQAERQRISSDMHDDIGTGLSTMLIYVNILKLKLNGTGNSSNIDRIATLGDELVNHMKEIVWALSPGNDKLDLLLLFIRQYFVLLFEPLAYDIDFVFPQTVADIEMKGEMRRNIFLCVKEALNNVIKHANATSVELRVDVKNNKLSIQVKDNGDGLPETYAIQTGGNGLNNIKLRMNAINGKFKFFNNNGAVVWLEADL